MKLNISFSLCRLELKGNKYVLGEFIEFKGKEEDLLVLRKIKRSKISQLSVQKISMFGLGNSFLFPFFLLYSIKCFRIWNDGFTHYFHNLQLSQLSKFCIHPVIIVLMGLPRLHIGKKWPFDLARRYIFNLWIPKNRTSIRCLQSFPCHWVPEITQSLHAQGVSSYRMWLSWGWSACVSIRYLFYVLDSRMMVSIDTFICFFLPKGTLSLLIYAEFYSEVDLVVVCYRN